ncbi:NF-kappa-B-repressing factor [Gastrophryne carolinensis]
MAGQRPVCLEDLRQYHENERQWRARREFLARHLHLYPGPKLDQLIALSMVWSNVVFIGNRYGEQLTQKVHQMGEGIDIGEMPSFELVPGAKKTAASTSADGQPMKKKFGPRPRFDPVHFVASTVAEDKVFQETSNMDRQDAPDSTSLAASTMDKQRAPLKANNLDKRVAPGPIRFVASTMDKRKAPFETSNLDRRVAPSPVPFVASTVEEYRAFFETSNMNRREAPNSSLVSCTEEYNEEEEGEDAAFIENTNMNRQEPSNFHAAGDMPQISGSYFPPSDRLDAEDDDEMEFDTCPYIYDPVSEEPEEDNKKGDFGHFLNKLEQNYSAKFESHSSSIGKDFRSRVLDSWDGLNKQGRKGIGFVKPPKQPGRHGHLKQRANASVKRAVQSLDKSDFIKFLSSIVKRNMLNPPVHAENKQINYTQVLSFSVQACKTNPTYIYMCVKGQQLKGAPKPRGPRGNGQAPKAQCSGFACEVKCLDIYLATGYSLSKTKARDEAAKLAVELLLKPTVTVTTVRRKLGAGFCDDVVAVSPDTCVNEIPPALKQETTPVKSVTSSKPLSEFTVIGNSGDAIGMLTRSAEHSKMAISYQYDEMPNNLWRCCVYVEDHYVAEGFGTKKSSRHAAAELAVRVLQARKPTMSAPIATPTVCGPVNKMKDFVIYENSSNPVCTLNDTAQINKVSIEFVFEKAAGPNWKCKVFLEQKFIAEAVGVKKTVKYEAAEAAMVALRKTYPVMVNNIRKSPAEAAISRNQIKGLSSEEAYKQEIKEDNIGNQLLRKMGWTGGGLGKEGDGIAEPIKVKEQFRREGLGSMPTNLKINRRDIEGMIRNYAWSYSKDELTFSKELSNEERKLIHQLAHKYGLKSRSHGKGAQRFLVVSRKMNTQDLINTLKQEGTFGSYALVMPQQ